MDLFRGWVTALLTMMALTFVYSLVIVQWLRSADDAANPGIGGTVLYVGLGGFLLYLLPTFAAGLGYPRRVRYGTARRVLGIALVPVLFFGYELVTIPSREPEGLTLALQLIGRPLGIVAGTALAWILFARAADRQAAETN